MKLGLTVALFFGLTSGNAFAADKSPCLNEAMKAAVKAVAAEAVDYLNYGADLSKEGGVTVKFQVKKESDLTLNEDGSGIYFIDVSVPGYFAIIGTRISDLKNCSEISAHVVSTNILK